MGAGTQPQEAAKGLEGGGKVLQAISPHHRLLLLRGGALVHDKRQHLRLQVPYIVVLGLIYQYTYEVPQAVLIGLTLGTARTH